jgi:hypothetical protein
MVDLKDMIKASLDKEDARQKKPAKKKVKKNKSHNQSSSHQDHHRANKNPAKHMQDLLKGIVIQDRTLLKYIGGEPDDGVIRKWYVPVIQAGLQLDFTSETSWGEMADDIMRRTASMRPFHPYISSIFDISKIHVYITDGFMSVFKILEWTNSMSIMYVSKLQSARQEQGIYLTNMEAEIVMSRMKRQYLIRESGKEVRFDAALENQEKDDSWKDHVPTYSSEEELRVFLKRWMKEKYRI